jgi:hypothetical protein
MPARTASDQANLGDLGADAGTASQGRSSLDRLSTVDWEACRPVLMEDLGYRDQEKGARTPRCPALMRKVLVLQRFFDLSDHETAFQVQDRFVLLSNRT